MSAVYPLDISHIEEPLPVSQWPANLALCFARTKRGTRLVDNVHNGPLYVQKAFYPEGDALAHVYLLHPPGGIVSGDALNIDLQLTQNTQVLFTTPGAGRIYRARQDRCLQEQKVCLRVSEQSSAEWFPMETIVYPNASAKLTTRIELAHDSHFLGWEICCLGLPASNKLFSQGDIKQRFEIIKAGKLQLLENFSVNAKDDLLLNGKAGLQSKTVNGIFIAGPFDLINDHSVLMASLRSINAPSTVLFASSLVGEFIVIRYLGNSAEQARKLYIECWRYLRVELLARKICRPRIWKT